MGQLLVVLMKQQCIQCSNQNWSLAPLRFKGAWGQLVESDYKNVATVINPLVYWLSFTDGLISLTDPRLLRNDGFVIKDLKRLSNLGPEVVSRGILTSIA